MSIDSIGRLKETVQTAASAVSGLSDERMRLIAFEVVLTHLVSGSKGTAGVEQPRLASVTAAPKGPRTRTVSRAGPTAWLKELVDESFFAQERTLADVVAKFAERGHVLASKDLTGQVEKLLEAKVLRRQKKAPAEGGREVWFYSNW